MDEDAVTLADYDLEELLPQDETDTAAFREKYLGFYDDIKTTPKDDW